MNEPRFLLGYGERLTAPIPPPISGGQRPEPYEFDEAVSRLQPELLQLSETLDALPHDVCPANQAVGVVRMHPQRFAKSYHPRALLQQYNLRAVGSRPIEISPEKWTRAGAPEPSPTTELYVAGDRSAFAQLADDAANQPSRIHKSIQWIEEIATPTPSDRIRNLDGAAAADHGLLVELILHATANDGDVLRAFARYVSELDVDVRLERRLFAGGLCFMPAQASAEEIEALARFTFLRTARPLSRLRHTPSIERSHAAPHAGQSVLPDQDAISQDIQVAVFDGGLPHDSPLGRWVNAIEPADIGAAEPDLVNHGHDVSSAVLFGSLTPGQPAPRPFANVDHYRVLDRNSGNDPYELYDVLRRIDAALTSKHYDFVNLSLGPAVCMEDDDIHPWTAVLDERLSTGATLATIAIGNNGGADDHEDRRIQIPGDALNGLALGAADSARTGWARADYSAFGPGRAPGYVKPDVVDFGGSATEPFIVTDRASRHQVAYTSGTSFASPAALRRAIALRSHFGERLTPLGIRALLIHTADPAERDRLEVGWGRVPTNLDEIVTCGDGQVRIIFQGALNPAQYLRAQVPWPADAPTGLVTISATFAFASEVDAEDPGNYSRAGLDITFRPHAERFERADSADPISSQFFKRGDYDTEDVLRTDAMKWSTTLHAERRMRGTSLYFPAFDVHYNARANGADDKRARAIPYALVLTVESKNTNDLYERIVRAYANRLEVLQPIIELPVRV